jgi:hypothetical protein
VSVCTHVGVQAFAGTIDPSRVKFTVSCTATTESVLPAFALLVSCDPALLRLLVAHRQRWERTHGRPPRKSRARSFPRGHGRNQGKIIHRVASPPSRPRQRHGVAGETRGGLVVHRPPRTPSPSRACSRATAASLLSAQPPRRSSSLLN